MKYTRAVSIPFPSWTQTVLLAASLVWLAQASLAADESAKPHGEFRGALPTEYPAWFKESFLDFHEDIQEAAQEGRRMAILFHQDGCPYCNFLVERNFAQRDIETYARKHFDFVALNMWGDREVVPVNGETYSEKELAAALKVQYTPTLMFFDERGQVALRVDGYLPPARFKHALKYVAEKRESEVAYHEYMAAFAPKGKTNTPLNAQPFFMPTPLDMTTRDVNKPYVLLFEQKDCPSCDALHRDVLDLPETRELLGAFDVAQVDMWSESSIRDSLGRVVSAKALANGLKISYAPTMVLFDADGREVIRADGFFHRFHIQSIIDYVKTKAHQHEPSFQRYISERAEAFQEKGIDVDLLN